MKLQFLINYTFSANEKWYLAEKSTLNQPEQYALADILRDENIFGVFKPVDDNRLLSSKIAYKDVALLFYYLQQPSTLPAFIIDSYDDEINAMIAKLICEEILSIQTEDGFVSGIKAERWLFKQEAHYSPSFKAISQLSSKAIQYAIQYKNVDQAFITSALYTYNVLPTPLTDYITDIEKFLNIGFNTALEKKLRLHWSKHLPTKAYNWIMWSRKTGSLINTKKAYTYKLYISPALHCLPEVFEKTAGLLYNTGALGFKTGADHHGIARSDKFIIYFSGYAEMKKAADMLTHFLEPFAAHGVPFTAALDDKGLISWGIDPPAAEVIQQLEGGSWRAGVAEKISSAIIQAKSNSLDKKGSFDFVYQKMLTEGINPLTWTPLLLKPDYN